MRNQILILFILFLLLNACKKRECEGTHCPLTTGELCLNGSINVNDSCVCPDDSYVFGDFCKTYSSGVYYFNINCLSFNSFSAAFNSIGNLNYEFITDNDSRQVLSGYLGDSTNFTMMLDFQCELPNGILARPWLVGGISNDTMEFDIEWHFFYYEDSIGNFYLRRPDEGEYIPPLYYLDSIADYSCGTSYSAAVTE